MIAGLLVWAASLPTAPTAADTPKKEDALQAHVAEFAEVVAKRIRAAKEKSVGVGPFTGPKDGSGGPGLANLFQKALAAQGLTVATPARFTLKGSFKALKSKERNSLVVELTLELDDVKKGSDIAFDPVVWVLPEPRDIILLAGVTADLQPTPKERQPLTILTKSYSDPAGYIAGTRVASSASSPFEVELCVKDPKSGNYVPRKPELKDGEAHVSLNRDEVYAIRIYSRAKFEAAAYITIDGLDVFSFTEKHEAGKFTAILVPNSKGGIEIAGWPIDVNSSDEFKVTEYAKTGSARLKGSAAAVGIVTVQFAAAWPEGERGPDDEPANEARSDFGTGFGERIATPFKPVARKFGTIRSAVTIRYNR